MSVRFGTVQALREVTCRFGGVGVRGLIGVNGAGKTTLIHALIGMTPVTEGAVIAHASLDQVAYCPDTPSFEPWFSAREVLAQSARLGRTGGRQPSLETVDGLLDRVGLGAVADRRVGGFSRGMRQRLGIAAALVREPRLLFLDEPTSALDPIGRDDVLRLVRELGEEMLVVFSSHILDDIDAVADELLVLGGGEVVFDGPRREFVAAHTQSGEVAVDLTGDPRRLRERLDQAGCPWRSEASANGTTLVPQAQLPALLGVLPPFASDVVSVRRTSGSLARAFLASVPDASLRHAS